MTSWTYLFNGVLKFFLLFFQDEIGLNEWSISLRNAHKHTLELLSSMARKAGKIYGADIDSNSKNSPVVNRERSANGGNQIWKDEESKDNLHPLVLHNISINTKQNSSVSYNLFYIIVEGSHT